MRQLTKEDSLPITILNYINLLSAILLTASLPLFMRYQRPFLYIFFVTYILEFFFQKKWQNFRTDKLKWVFIAFLVFFLLIPLYQLFESNHDYAGKIMQTRLPFLAFGLIGLFGFNKLYKLHYFAVTVLVSSFLIFCFLVFYRVGVADILFSSSEMHDPLSLARKTFINNHMAVNSYLNSALIFLFYLLNQKSVRKLDFCFKIAYFIMGLSVVALLLFPYEGRTGFLTAIIIISIMILYKVWKWKRFVAILLSFVVGFAAFLLIVEHPRMNQQQFENNPRLVLWNISTDMIAKKPIFGYGSSTAADIFITKCTKSPQVKATQDELLLRVIAEKNIVGAHPHNQYLQTTMEFGMIGLFLLLFFHIYPIFVVCEKRRIYVFLFLFISALQATTDVYGCGYYPLMFVMILTLLLVSEDKKKSELEQL